MQVDTDGYTTELMYSSRFHRTAAPSWLHCVANALGHDAPNPSAAYHWCELGCGTGAGAALLAAANPHAQFYAVDFNADHIAAGKALAADAGLCNMHFQHASFAALADLPDQALPRFDYIVLTGVYAWISPENQHAIHAFVQRFLAPGGIVYVSYPCYPGMAAIEPTRHLLYEFAQAADGTAAQRAKIALHQLRQLTHAGAAHLAEQPDLLQALDAMADRHPSYLVHDWLAPHWQIQQVGTVIRHWQASHCDWLGSAQPVDNIDDVALPESCIPLLSELSKPALRESAKAFAMNQALRHDMYQRDAQTMRLPPSAHRQILLQQRLHGLFAPTDEAADARAQQLLSSDFLQPLAQAVAKGVIRYEQCIESDLYADQPGMVSAAFQLLMAAGVAHPILQNPPDPRPAQALNLQLCERALKGEQLFYLAAPALGSAIPVNLAQMAAYYTVQRNGLVANQPLAEQAWQAWRAFEPSLPAKPNAKFVDDLANFSAQLVPYWQVLGVMPV